MLWYSQLQFIACAVPTQPAYGRGRYIAMQRQKEDIRSRCMLMKLSAEKARAQAETSSSCLKVFVAPEFYFRGRTGAYDLEGLQAVVSQLRAWASAPQWRDWLFFFGTVVGTFLDPNNQNEVINAAVVHRGGSGPDGTRIVMKEALAPDDFLSAIHLRNTTNPARGILTMEQLVGLKDGTQFDAVQNRGPGKEHQERPFDGTGVFDEARVRFAVEVCADHLVSRLAKSPTAWLDWLPQVQVITSCGVGDFNADSVVASKDGFVFRCDGFFAETQQSVAAHSRLSKVTGARTRSQGATLQEVQRTKTVKLRNHLPMWWKHCFSEAGELHVYPSQAAPWGNVRWW
ncbi:hypothetical protein [Corallococcus exercitus]|uniref:Uncharacterized protein n=1 Tax=Corallococcus exercitus TaxID=2316736 RepID=A0A7Y4NDN1_9BACT|nr:hypothetical protein [Corallococcus exercitus]NOK09596.1 hypothetical protein [Corallococcus exercitus]